MQAKWAVKHMGWPSGHRRDLERWRGALLSQRFVNSFITFVLFTEVPGTALGTDISKFKISTQWHSHSRGGRHTLYNKQYISKLYDLLEDCKYDAKKKKSTRVREMVVKGSGFQF